MRRPAPPNRLHEYLPPALNAATGAGVLIVSFMVDLRFDLPPPVAKWTGIACVAGGMLIVVWAATCLKAAFLGEVQPRLDKVVCEGPYRFVRHPVYLGMAIALFGAALAVRSWPGILGTLLLFLPSEIYRAVMEERALRRRFGEQWRRYAARTGFLLPRLLPGGPED